MLNHYPNCLKPRLLGTDFAESPEAKETVGDEWWAENLEIVRQKKELELCDAATAFDLF